MKKTNPIFSFLALLSMLAFIGCSDDDVPPAENEEEVIDLVRLTFTPNGGAPLVFEAIDPDGEGPNDFNIPTIALAVNTQYLLSIEVENTQAGENITEEISAEADEHMFFFEFSPVFENPVGNGNVDNRADAINYNDIDSNTLPIGLSTTWLTGAATTGEFRLILKHQPGIKSTTSTATDGESDIDLTWNLEIQ